MTLHGPVASSCARGRSEAAPNFGSDCVQRVPGRLALHFSLARRGALRALHLWRSRPPLLQAKLQERLLTAVGNAQGFGLQ